MSLKVAIQMDAIESINIDSDTSFILGLEAQKRGYELYYYQPENLSLYDGLVVASLQKITLQRVKDNHFKSGKAKLTDLSTMDVVLMRQDPPYDMNYLTYTYFLDKIHPKTLVVNNPAEVRNCPEKLFVCDFKEFTPPTLISSDLAAIKAFKKQHGDIVVKPLYSFGGRDVYKISNDLEERVGELLDKYRTPLIAQKFLKEITQGDKRIILINGEVAGMINRIPQEGEIRSNLAQGGTGEKTTLTKREKEICAVLKPELKKRGLLLAGIDVIGGYLTEINVTSPTGLQVINRLYDVCLEAEFWDMVEGKLRTKN